MHQNQWLNTLGFVLFSHLVWAAKLPVPEFINQSTETTESGYLKLSWRIAEVFEDQNIPIDFELQQSRDKAFKQATLIYHGPDYATFLSGLPNGDYYYRVRSSSQDETQYSKWSNSIWVQVRHHSLALALWLFGIGAIVFLLTVVIVIQGARTVAQNNS